MFGSTGYGKLGLVGGLGPDHAKHYILHHHMNMVKARVVCE